MTNEQVFLFDHVEEKINESKYFLQAMDLLRAKHVEHVRSLRRPFEGEGRAFVKMFQYNFSAYLSAHRTTRYYVNRVSGKIQGTAEWRRAIDADMTLEALHHLRDADIHDETLNVGMTMSIRQGQFSFSGLHLHERALAANSRIAKRPEILRYLLSKSIIDIATEGLKSLESVVEDGRRRGFLKPQPLP
ncbi:MAG TPA: hypothetical protein VGG22_07925 [Candidatus Baltobacteraceae bacterium]|jgi:hypothetical protein